MKRGKYSYVPREPLIELDELKIEFNLKRDAEAFKRMAEFSAMGRELARNLNFRRNRR